MAPGGPLAGVRWWRVDARCAPSVRLSSTRRSSRGPGRPRPTRRRGRRRRAPLSCGWHRRLLELPNTTSCPRSATRGRPRTPAGARPGRARGPADRGRPEHRAGAGMARLPRQAGPRRQAAGSSPRIASRARRSAGAGRLHRQRCLRPRASDPQDRRLQRPRRSQERFVLNAGGLRLACRCSPTASRQRARPSATRSIPTSAISTASGRR